MICTARNAAATIAATIESILAQDFPNWEMIIIDDGSTDDTASIVRGFASSDSRVRLIVTHGVGRGRALNLALAEAKADLVANIDADDESHPVRLRCQLEAMKQHPEFAVISTDWIRIYDAMRPSWMEIADGTAFAVADVTKALASHNPVYHSSMMMRKAGIVGLGGYDEALTSVVDYDLCVRCVAAGLRLGRIQLPLVAQRIHSGQSYTYARKWRYFVAGALVQARATRALGLRRRYLPLIVLRLLWAVLPLRVRLGLRDLWVWYRLRQTQT